MASRNLYLDTDNDTDGRSFSRQKDTQNRSSSRNNITDARRNGSAPNGSMLEGMESSPTVNGQYDQNNDERHSVLSHLHLTQLQKHVTYLLERKTRMENLHD